MIKISSNIFTNDGKSIILDRTWNSSPTRNEVSQGKIGIGTTDAVNTDTDIERPVPWSGTEQIDDCETANWSDSADMTTSLNTTTFKQGSNSLNLIKDGTASAIAYTEKNTTSLDFTSKELSIWLYIADSTTLDDFAVSDCIKIWFGNDSSNYYEWTKDRTDLVVGWNLIDCLTSSNGSETGSVTLASCDYTRVNIITDAAGTTWSAGDLAMDDLKLISSNDYLKNFEGGYPVIDFINNEVELRLRAATSEANGYGVSEIGSFNTDSPELMESRITFSPISKSDTEEIIFIIKYNIT